MRPGNIAKRVNHGENDETKCERNTYVRDSATARVVDDERARSGEDERKGSEKFGAQFFHRSK